MPRMRLIASLLAVVLAWSEVLCAQVQIGTPQFATFSTPGPEVINIGDLNVFLDIPIIRKQGRGLPMNYDLAYNSSIWYPVASGTKTSWMPVQGMGWTGLSPAGAAGMSYSMTYATGQCYNNGVVNYQSWTYSAGTYTDILGNTHGLAGQIIDFTAPGGNCPPAGPQPSASLKLTSNDGSGITGTMTVQGFGGPATFQVIDRNGNAMNVPATVSNGSPQGSFSQQDRNGNVISAANGQYTDTTGKTALSVIGSAPSNTNLSFTNASGNLSTYAVSYKSYTVHTAFGCGVGEYGPTATNLVDRVTLPDGSYYQFGYEPTPGVAGDVTARIASVTLPTGGTISYGYSGGSNGIVCADGSTAGLTRSTSATQAAPAATWTYSRTPASGSSQTQLVDGLNNYSIYKFVMPASAPTKFYETYRQIFQGNISGPVLLERFTCYDGAAEPCDGQSFQIPFTEIDVTSDYNGGTKDVRKNTYDAVENLRGVAVYQVSALVETGAFTYNQYNTPATIKLYDGVSGSLFSSTTYGFDETAVTPTSGLAQHSAALPKPGNQTSVTVNTSATSTLVTNTTAYYDTGQPVSTTSPSGKTTYQYDASQTFVTSSLLPTPSSGVSLSTGTSYDITSGAMLSATGVNTGQTYTVNQYDTLLRPTAITMPNGGQISYTYSPIQASMSENLNKTTGENAASTTLSDAYGRTVSSAVLSVQSSNTWYQSDTCYDQNGNVSFSSVKYQSSGVGGAPHCSGQGASYGYDALGRVTSVTTSDGTATTKYQGRAVQSTDVNGVQKITQYDVLGRMLGVCEISSNSLAGQSPAPCTMDIGGTGYITGYGYDLVGHTFSTAQGPQKRSFQTDWAGRPATNSEAERGLTSYTYTYNATGLQVTRTRPKANQTSTSVYTHTTTQYDSLGRPVSVTYDDGLTPNKNYYYDTVPSALQWNQTPSNPKGQLVATSSGSGSTLTRSLLNYDLMGNVTSLLQCAPSICGGSAQSSRGMSFGYDLGNHLISEGDGASGEINYTRSPAGEVTSIVNASYQGTGNPANLVSNVVNSPFGPTSYSLGNGLQTAQSYDSLGRNSGGWVCSGSSQAYCSGGSQLYGNLVSWDGARAISSCDTSVGQCQFNNYDEFSRLNNITSTTNGGPLGSYTFSYDRWGNRLSQTSSSGGPSPNAAVSPATNQIVGYAYDAAGNLTNDGLSHSFTYDAEGNVLQVNGGSGGSYVYDALNHRVSVQTSSGTNEYNFDPFGQRVSTWLTSINFGIEGRIYWDGKQIAYRAQNGQTFFEHQSVLGTERLRTNYQGAVAASESSGAFGDNFKQNVALSDGDQDNNQYAGQEADPESGSSHAQFRQYSSTLGRWMSPDPYDGSYDVTNPQSLNRYTYALNNPYSAIDPLGLDLPDCGDDIITCIDGGDPIGGGPPPPCPADACVVANPDPPIDPCEGLCGLPSQPTLPQLPSGGLAVAPNNVTLTPQAQGCQAKIQGAVNNALNTNSTFLGPTVGPGMNSMGYRNGAYNFNYFAPGVVNPVAGSNGGSGRFPGSGLHIPLPGGADPTIMPWGYNASAGGSYFTAHYDSANPTDDLISFFEHIINDVILRRAHGC